MRQRVVAREDDDARVLAVDHARALVRVDDGRRVRARPDVVDGVVGVDEVLAVARVDRRRSGARASRTGGSRPRSRRRRRRRRSCRCRSRRAGSCAGPGVPVSTFARPAGPLSITRCWSGGQPAWLVIAAAPAAHEQQARECEQADAARRREVWRGSSRSLHRVRSSRRTRFASTGCAPLPATFRRTRLQTSGRCARTLGWAPCH